MLIINRFLNALNDSLFFSFFGVLKKKKKVWGEKQNMYWSLSHSSLLNQHESGNGNDEWIFLHTFKKLELVGVILLLSTDRVPSLGFGPEKVLGVAVKLCRSQVSSF